MSNPIDVFSVMLAETAIANGLKPEIMYGECDPELRKKIWIEAQDNLRLMCRSFIRRQMKDKLLDDNPKSTKT